MKHGVLEVPGAMLYYEMRGSGPVLLMIHGGNGDAESYPIADRLSDRYTVVTYDRRGHSRSRLEDPNEKYRVSAHSDDASRLLAALTDEPAYVFGCSSGAVIGLDLAVRHPEQIRMLVAHEPPIPQLLAGSDRAKGFESLENLEKQYKRSGLQGFRSIRNSDGHHFHSPAGASNIPNGTVHGQHRLFYPVRGAGFKRIYTRHRQT